MRSVVVCGSKKYKQEIDEFCMQLASLGVVVYEPNFQEPVQESDFIKSEHLTRVVFKGLTLEHFAWIRKADVCFVFNKDDYAGVSVSMEMAYASALDKPVYALTRETKDPCRNALIDKVAESPQELIELLR